MELKGTNGIVSADNEKITISRKSVGGFLTQGIKGNRVIYYKDMTSIEFKKPTILANGYIQFIVNPELAVNQEVGLVGTSKDAFKDPNALILRAMKKERTKECEKFYAYVQSNLDKVHSNSSVSSVSLPDELIKYKQLLDEGILTQEEFDSKKKQLLNL